jgi:hypothetical protein
MAVLVVLQSSITVCASVSASYVKRVICARLKKR